MLITFHIHRMNIFKNLNIMNKHSGTIISLARQAAVPPPRNYRDGLSRNNFQIDPTTVPNQGENVLGAMAAPKRDLLGVGRKPWYPRPDSRGSILDRKIAKKRRDKCHHKLILKTSTPEHEL